MSNTAASREPDTDLASAAVDASSHAMAQAPRGRILSNGRYTTVVSDAGGGYSALGALALTRWTPDRTRDADGAFIYVRDVESDTIWSAAHQPIRRRTARYEARLDAGRVSITREDDGIETRLVICVADDADAEVRRLTLTNTSDHARTLEITTYAEVVLNSAAADAGHPAFSKLFVQTGWSAATNSLLAWRRQRSPDDEPLWFAHRLMTSDTTDSRESEPQRETDRARFIGRGRSTASPRAMDVGVELSGTVGNVLDPVFALRRSITIAAGASASLTALYAAASTQQDVEALILKLSAPGVVDAVLDRAAGAHASDDSSALPESWGAELPRLTGALLYGDPAYRASPETIRRNVRPLTALAPYELTGGAYLVLVRPSPESARITIPAIARVVSDWRAQGLAVDLLIVDDGTIAADALAHLPAHASDASDARRGRTRVLRAADVNGDDLVLLECAAHLLVEGGLATNRSADIAPNEIAAPSARARRDKTSSAPPPATAEPLQFFNGFGGFSADGAEYVIRVEAGDDGPRWPPAPWVNVMANEEGGCLVSESGAGYSWSANSRENRLTPWMNDPVSDPHADALYVRDDDTGALWTPTPGPAPAPVAYEVRHGFGYTRYLSTHSELEQEVLCFVPREDSLRVMRVRITNHGSRPRNLSLASYSQWVLGVLPGDTSRFVVTERDARTGAILAVNRANNEFADRVAFATAIPAAGTQLSSTADRTAFLGRWGNAADPAALRTNDALDGRSGPALDPCAAFRMPTTLAPGATVECAFLLGQASNQSAANAVLARYADHAAIAAALEEVRTFWREMVSGVQVETPSPEIDLMVNGWLVYQNLSCRVWGRSAFYQSGGAYGFRDQLQDSAALVYLQPELTRRQILLHAAHQFVEGDVLHWWHPPLSRGIRTKFRDDLLWLPYITAFYVRSTGDESVLAEQARFVRARELGPDEDEAYLVPEDSGLEADVYEHCCRSIDRSLTAGPHGLPLMGAGDWNDGMNRVGREGRGESVWLGFFLHSIITDFVPFCDARGDTKRAATYRAYQTKLDAALNDAGWDGAWYRRAYYDDGTPLGSAQSDECRIDAIAQAWAVLSGVAPPDRAASALDSMEKYLVSEREGIIRLLTPAFDRTPHDPGYIKGYLPGVRENGGQYTHGALWAVRALAEFGRHDRAERLLEILSPVHRGRTTGDIEVYRVEPYVIAADVYGVAPHVGRGGWTWYTGSAGWMYRVALESVLGVEQVDGNELALRPCIPASWPGFTLRYRLRDARTTYEIVVTRAACDAAATGSLVDGAPARIVDGAVRVTLNADEQAHRVQLVLGEDVQPRYFARARRESS